MEWNDGETFEFLQGEMIFTISAIALIIVAAILGVLFL